MGDIHDYHEINQSVSVMESGKHHDLLSNGFINGFFYPITDMEYCCRFRDEHIPFYIRF